MEFLVSPIVKAHMIFVALSLPLIGSCASSINVVPEKLSYKSVDNLLKHQIEISYVNNSHKDICLPYAVFPLEGQVIGWGSHSVSLIVDTVRYPIVDSNPGYCASNCETKVSPGEKIFGSIPYSAFNLPNNEFLKGKKLEYVIYGFACRK